MNNKTRVAVKDVMNTDFIKLDGMQTVRHALNAMKENKSEVAIVNKRDKHDAYGIITLSDIAKKVLAKDKSLDRVNIYEIMTKPVVSVPPQMDVRYCARLYDQFGLSCTPVIESEEILGLVGFQELLIKAFEQFE